MKEEIVDVQEIQDKLADMHIKDIEVSAVRDLKKPFNIAVCIIALAMSLFHIYVLLIRPIDPWYFRILHVVFAGILIFFLLPGWKSAPKDRLHFVDYLFILLLIIPTLYVFFTFDDWIFRAGVMPTTFDFYMSIIFVLTVIEMTRRSTGLPLAILSGIVIVYAYFGNYMPGILYHRGYSWDRIFTFLLSLDGILSIPVMASATYIFIFVIFGAFVEASGSGKFFVELARCAAGRFRGGPGKVSILSSAMIGTASGSSVANVVIDGVFNIPMMKNGGFKAHIAAAIEAMNSNGGQIVPPVMGAGAFLMAELLGVPYSKVALAAVIPAIMYFTAAYWMIDFYAASAGLQGLRKEQLPIFRKIIWEKGYLLLSLFVLAISLMIFFYSPSRSAMLAILTIIIVSWTRKDTRLGFKNIIQTLINGAKTSIEIAATCAAAGIIVGVLTQTGLGLKFAMIVITYSGGNLILALIFTMGIAIILGMGMPTTAAYAVSATMLAPALIQLGVPPIAAHLFIFYFACISSLTPPVALAAFAAAAISKSGPWLVGWHSMRFALAGFIIPYMFVYGPAMVLIGTPIEITSTLLTGLIGTLSLSASVQGWLLVRANYIERGILFFAALCLIKPGYVTDIIGISMMAIVFAFQYRRYKMVH